MARKSGSQLRNESALQQICPFAHTLGLLGRRWRPALLWKLAAGLKHYGELGRALPGITDKMLAQELSALVAASLIVREDTGLATHRTAYALTDTGRSIIPLLASMYAWGSDHLADRQPSMATTEVEPASPSVGRGRAPLYGG